MTTLVLVDLAQKSGKSGFREYITLRVARNVGFTVGTG